MVAPPKLPAWGLGLSLTERGARDRARTRAATSVRSSWEWLASLATSVILIGRGLGPGSLPSLDLVATPRIPVPRGIWGLGPELPRRVPVGVALSWGSALVSGGFAVKVLLVASVTVAFVGATRLARGAPAIGRAAAGILYAAGPFMATRIGAGHLILVVAVGVLPWVLPTLLRPADDARRTFLAALALGLTGFIGGLYVALPVAVGLVASRQPGGRGELLDRRSRGVGCSGSAPCRSRVLAPVQPGRGSGRLRGRRARVGPARAGRAGHAGAADGVELPRRRGGRHRAPPGAGQRDPGRGRRVRTAD